MHQSHIGKTSVLLIIKVTFRGIWVAQSVEHLTSAQVTISRFVASSPTSGSVLTAGSPEPASDSVSPSLSAPSPAHALALSLALSLPLSLSQKRINIKRN